MKTNSMILAFSVGIFFSVFSSPSYAFGPKPPAPPADTQAWPTRNVSFAQFSSTPFTLPNGTKVDMSTELPNLMVAEVTNQSAGRLRVLESVGASGSSGGPHSRYVLQGGLTSFEANNVTNSITIGFQPGTGDIGSGTIAGASGALTFNVGTLDMIFYIVDTTNGQVVGVGKGSAIEGSVGLNVSIDFTVVKTADQFVYQSAMTPVITKAIDNAISQMVNDPKTNLNMDWEGAVTTVNSSAGDFLFNFGQRDNIQVNNVFNVYDNLNNLIGEAKVTGVDVDSSTVAFKNDPNGKLLGSVRAADAVKIFYINP